MTPVYQTRHGWPHGNCLMASIASILDLRLEDCPDLGPADGEDGPDDWLTIQDFARKHGREPVWLDSEKVPCPPAGYSVASVMRPNGIPHAMVALDGEIVHNPVEGAPLRFPAKVRGYIAFVPLVAA